MTPDPTEGNTGGDSDATARERRAYREFVRTHHPDVGGDPDEFVAGIARLRAGPSRTAKQPDASQPDTAHPRARKLAVFVVALWRTIERHRQPPGTN